MAHKNQSSAEARNGDASAFSTDPRNYLKFDDKCLILERILTLFKIINLTWRLISELRNMLMKAPEPSVRLVEGMTLSPQKKNGRTL